MFLLRLVVSVVAGDFLLCLNIVGEVLLSSVEEVIWFTLQSQSQIFPNVTAPQGLIFTAQIFDCLRAGTSVENFDFP